MHRLGTATDILHIIMQAQPSALPWLGPVLPGAEGMVIFTMRTFTVHMRTVSTGAHNVIYRARAR